MQEKLYINDFLCSGASCTYEERLNSIFSSCITQLFAKCKVRINFTDNSEFGSEASFDKDEGQLLGYVSLILFFFLVFASHFNPFMPRYGKSHSKNRSF